jgi:hypothetical protein
VAAVCLSTGVSTDPAPLLSSSLLSPPSIMSDDDSSRKGKGAGKSSSKKKNSVKQPAAALKKESKKRDESPDGSKAARPSKKREESPDPIIKELKHAGKVTKKGTEGTATAARGRDALYDLAESIDSLPQGAGKRECVVAFNRMAKYYDGLIMHYAAKRDALRERGEFCAQQRCSLGEQQNSADVSSLIVWCLCVCCR